MPKVIQLVTDEKQQNHVGKEQIGSISMTIGSKSPDQIQIHTAATLCALVIWIAVSILNDFLLFREVLASSFIIVCLMVLKRAGQNSNDMSFEREF
jgi:hypothetical protein